MIAGPARSTKLRALAWGGVSLIALAAAHPAWAGDSVPPAVFDPLTAVQIAETPPLTDPDTPWDQQRADTAEAATKALKSAIDGYKALGEAGIATGNGALAEHAKQMIKYFGELMEALGNRAVAELASGRNLGQQLTRTVRRVAGNGAKGKDEAKAATDALDKSAAERRQQSRAQTQTQGATRTAQLPRDPPPLGNTILPANPINSPTILGPGQGFANASPGDTILWSNEFPGDVRTPVGEFCANSGLCTPLQGGRQFRFAPAGPLATGAPSQALACAPGSTGPQLAARGAMRTYLDNAAFIDRGAFLDIAGGALGTPAAASSPGGVTADALFARRQAVSDTLTQANLTLDKGLRFDRQTGPNTESGREPSPVSPDLVADWNLLSPRVGTNYQLGEKTLVKANYALYADQIASELPGPTPHPYITTYVYGYFDDRNGDRIGSSGSLLPFPTSDTLDEDLKAPKTHEAVLGLTHQIGRDVSVGVNPTYRRRFTDVFGVTSVKDETGAIRAVTIDDWKALDITKPIAAPGRGCDVLPPPSVKLQQVANVNVPFATGWEQIVPPTPGAGAVCQPLINVPRFATQLRGADFRSFGNLDNDFKFGFSYRESPVDSCSFWDGRNYLVYAGPVGGMTADRLGDFEPSQPLTIQLPRPNDPLASSRGTWRQNYDDQWWLRAINWLRADGTSVLPAKGEPVTVAVIDTGLDMRHPELFGAVWVNPKEPRKPPRDGLVRNPMKARWFGWNFLDNSSDLSDFNGHGTVVAGIIAAGVNNRTGIAGINPWARIMPLKVADHRGRTDTIAVAKAIVYAANNGARVINVSLGGNALSETVKRAIDYAAGKDALIVVSSGNEGIDVKGFTPSAFANTIAVAAVDRDLKRAGFSNFGDNVAIAAPGVDILSLRAGGTDLMMHVRKDYAKGSAIVAERYYRVDGTSFAAPMVAGVASLILSARPELTAAQVRRMLLHSARDVTGEGRNKSLGYGLLDADAALTADPAFFIEAGISGLSVVRDGGRTAVRVAGEVDADRLKSAWIEIGEGEAPSVWKKVTGEVTRAVRGGAIADVDARDLAGAKVWTVRLVVEHQNGRKRFGRFLLRLG